MQEHVAQVLSLLKMQLYDLEHTMGNEMATAQMPGIIERLSHCIYILRDLHAIESPATSYTENWIEQLRMDLISMQAAGGQPVSLILTGIPVTLSHQCAVILSRMVLTVARHLFFLCEEGIISIKINFGPDTLTLLLSDDCTDTVVPQWIEESMELMRFQAAIINAELWWDFSENKNGNQIILKLAL